MPVPWLFLGLAVGVMALAGAGGGGPTAAPPGTAGRGRILPNGNTVIATTRSGWTLVLPTAANAATLFAAVPNPPVGEGRFSMALVDPAGVTQVVLLAIPSTAPIRVVDARVGFGVNLDAILVAFEELEATGVLVVWSPQGPVRIRTVMDEVRRHRGR